MFVRSQNKVKKNTCTWIMFVYVFIAISVYFIKSIRPVDLRG